MTSRFAAAVHEAVGGHPCAVALGGGADSAILLHAAVSAGTGAPVRAVFAYHGLESSPRLEQAARDLAAELDVPLTVVDAVVEDGPDLEARARQARYAAIEAILENGEVALTGHTEDDQAETVLMRLMRGSGAGGLSGIPAVRGPWRRPLLAFGRPQLRREAITLGLPFTDDPANTDGRFLRSRIRNQLIPELEQSYAPGIVGNLVRAAGLARSDDAVLASMADAIAVTTFTGHVSLPVPAITTAPLAVASRAVREALRLCGDPYPGSMDDIEAVLAVARDGSTAVVSGGIHMRREPPMIVFETRRHRPCGSERQVDGVASFTWGDAAFSLAVSRHPTPHNTRGRFSVVRIDASAGPVGIRPVAAGDRLDVGVGSAPVTELLRDHGVPEICRPCWLLITIDGKIAAVHGVRTAAWAMPRNGDDVMIIEGKVHS